VKLPTQTRAVLRQNATRTCRESNGRGILPATRKLTAGTLSCPNPLVVCECGTYGNYTYYCCCDTPNGCTFDTTTGLCLCGNGV
jgi:hypothetical protein